MFNWEDMRAFLSAAESGSLVSAARALAVDPATVSRRIARLESTLKATLLTRLPGGHHLTATGQRVYEEGRRAAMAMETAGLAATPDPSGGVVRLSVSEGFGTAIVAPELPAFRRQRPNIRLELVASAGFLSLTKYEADLAVTLAAPTSERVHVELLSEYRLGLFACPSYLAANGTPRGVDDLRGHEIIGYVEDLIYTPELRYLEEILPGLQATVSSSSIRAQQKMIASGGGIGVLPLFLANGLQPVLAEEVQLTRRFWVSTRREVRDVQRIRVTRTWLGDIARRGLALLDAT